jgi:hypothetical protein
MMKLTRETIDSSHESWFSKKGGEAVRTLHQGIPYKYRVLWLREIIEFMLEKHGMEGSYRTILKVFCETVPSEKVSVAFRSTWWSSKNNLKQMIKDILYPALKLAYNSKEKEKGNFRFLYDETADYAFGEALMELICESDIDMLPLVWELMLRKGLDLQKNSMFLLAKSKAEEPVLKHDKIP